MKFRKIPVRLIVTGAVAAVGIAWYDQVRLNETRRSLDALRPKAAALGLSGNIGDIEKSRFASKRDRDAAEAQNKKDVADFVNTLDQIADLGEENSAELELGKALMKQWMTLNARSLELFIEEAMRQSEPDSLFGQMVAISLVKLAAESPEAALSLLDRAADFLDGNPERQQFLEGTIEQSLASWAKKNPLAVVDWVQVNGKKHEALLSGNAKSQILTNAASVDLDLAFELIDRLGLNQQESILKITTTAASPLQRNNCLAALRQHLPAIEDDEIRSDTKQKALNLLATRSIQDGFVPATDWIESAGLDSQELGDVVSGLNYGSTLGETGRWIAWLSEHVTPDQSEAPVRQLVTHWTENDYQAAGEWLRSAPEGAVKKQAIQAYALTIAKYEPETARQWAMALPPGEERDATLREIK